MARQFQNVQFAEINLNIPIDNSSMMCYNNTIKREEGKMMFLVINKFGLHSVKPPFDRYEDAYRYAERLNRLRNLGWRVVEIYAGRD